MKRSALAFALSACAASAAMAADMAPPALMQPPAPYNWSGLYIGGNLGAAWTEGTFSDPIGNTFNESGASAAQFVGGGQVGANYEFWGGTVLGVEADFDWLANTNNTSNAIVDTFGNTDSLTANNRWLTTVTGRLGYAFDRVLVYGKGGGAWVGSSAPTITINGIPFSTNVNSNWGWTAGFGVEWAFAGTWSVRAEYDYIGLNGQSFTVPATAPGLIAGDVFTGSNRNIQLLTAGINYKFGPW
jgi:outer membrane immunogenic protein